MIDVDHSHQIFWILNPKTNYICIFKFAGKVFNNLTLTFLAVAPLVGAWIEVSDGQVAMPQLTCKGLSRHKLSQFKSSGSRSGPLALVFGTAGSI